MSPWGNGTQYWGDNSWGSYWNHRRNTSWGKGGSAFGGCQEGDWDCLAPACKGMVKFGGGNRRARTSCHLCGTAKPPQKAPTKAELEKAKADARAAAAATPAGDDDEEEGYQTVAPRRKSKKARRAAARKVAADEVAAAPAAPAAKPKAGAKAKATPKAGAKAQPAPKPAEKDENAMDSDEEDEDEAIPLPTAAEMDALKMSLWPPHELRDGWSAAKVVEAVVADDDQPQSAATTTAFKAELQQCVTILAMGAAAAKMGVDPKVTLARKTELEKLLVKSGKEASAAKSAVGTAQLRLHKEEYLRDYKETLDRSLAGASKARTRFVNLQLAQQKHINAWQAALHSTATEEEERQALWDERVALLLSQHGQVLQEFDKLIKATAQHTQEPPSAPASVAPTPGLARKAWKVAASADWDDLYLTAAVCPSELPTPTAPTEANLLAEMQALWGGIEAVSAMPGDTPASFAQLGSTAAAVRDLVGLEVWRKYYDGRDPGNDDVVPRNLLLRVSTQLTKLAETHRDAAVVATNIATARERLEAAFQLHLGNGNGKGKGKAEPRATPYSA